MDSVTGLLVLLDEPDDELQYHALKMLANVVDEHWAEISESILTIESLSEVDDFKGKELAASIASKCFFHLEEYDDALRLALSSGAYFDVGAMNEYSTTIVSKCIDTYIALRTQDADKDGDAEMKEGMDGRLESIVEGMFDKCYERKQFTEALGIALEAQRLDKIIDILSQGTLDEMKALLSHSLNVCQTLVSNRRFRLKVIQILVDSYKKLDIKKRDHLELGLCLHMLNKADEYAQLLVDLVKKDEFTNSYLVAYQVAFDLVELQDARFVALVLDKLPQVKSAEAETKAEEKDEAKDGETEPEPTVEMVDEKSEPEYAGRLTVLLDILKNGRTTALYLDYLYRHNKADLLLLKNIKTATETGRKNSVLHNATVVAHGYMHGGTTVDVFLRTNLEWLGRSSNWAKFSATASLGVVHKGNVEPAMTILEPYLPKDGVSQSPYSEGGGLYALGLIHSAEGVSKKAKDGALDYLISALNMASTHEAEATREVMQHGACLGIGLLSMSDGNANLLEQLRNIVYQDGAVPGEAAALAMGMVIMGGGEKHSASVEDMLGYAHDTAHEKIIRALALAIAMNMYGQEEVADGLIEQLCRDKDSLLRCGGIYTIALAYVGTSNNKAIRRLLHVAVSDVSNDVRRAAVTSLGFLMLNSADKLPSLIGLLSESYNPHVRYGSALALGIGCSGMEDPSEALSLLEVLVNDKVDFVSQGALIASAMLLMQENPKFSPKAQKLRMKLTKIMGDYKHSATMTRMGAILASGIIDAGGRNVNIQLTSKHGVPKPPAVLGMLMFLQYWYWYPNLHMLSLTFSPTVVMGVNKDLDLPKSFKVRCDCDVMRFDYPKPLVEKKEKAKVRVVTVELSTTAKAKAKEAKKKKEEEPAEAEPEAMDTTESGESEEKKEEDKEAALLKYKEDALLNPVRITRKQVPHVSTEASQRYTPVCRDKRHLTGIVVLSDATPLEPEEVTKVAVPPTGGDGGEEAEPPLPFIFDPSTGTATAV